LSPFFSIYSNDLIDSTVPKIRREGINMRKGIRREEEKSLPLFHNINPHPKAAVKNGMRKPNMALLLADFMPGKRFMSLPYSI